MRYIVGIAFQVSYVGVSFEKKKKPTCVNFCAFPFPNFLSTLEYFQFFAFSMFAQGGEVHRPGDQACQCGGFVQVGGKDPSGRGEGHGCHRPHAVQTGLRPPRQPSQLWQA